ncbi:GTP-binding protein TypA/BipA [Aggregatibacter aphrophilus NJ8700]|nr:GTP-binding protein TypA/BipA [Aggregatibacter aphrophilus NJ8700]
MLLKIILLTIIHKNAANFSEISEKFTALFYAKSINACLC